MKTTGELELPQIRFPIRGDKTEAELADEQAEIEKLRKIIERSFGEIADATGLSDEEVLHTIEDVHVEMLRDVLKEGTQVKGLKEGIQDAIKMISRATNLDTAQISDVLSATKDTDLDDMAERLYRSCQANRAKFGAGVKNMLSR